MQSLPACAEAFAAPFPGRIPAGMRVVETLWDTSTLELAQAQMSPYCKTLLSEIKINGDPHFYNVARWWKFN